MHYIWTTFFYDPILNALIAFYNGTANQNLGIALIELTIALRIVLLPLSILSIRARSKYERMRYHIHRLEETYKNDAIKQKEELRKLLNRNHINPWAKAAALGIQFVVLIILYRVFVTAVRTSDFTGLYHWNTAPDFLNTMFVGFDLSHHSLLWAAIIAVLLYIELWVGQMKRQDTLTNSDVMFRVAFPLAAGALLYLLPSGKSVFVLTSIVFTIMIEGIRWIFVRPKELTSVMGMDVIPRDGTKS